ncbi:MAG: MFS transporter [Mogibacterium sp.]|nr:MFS transporter [Mogibacterium sp.]
MGKGAIRSRAKSEYLEGLKFIITNRNYLVMMLISLCSNFAIVLTRPALSPYGVELGSTPSALAALMGTYYLVILVIRPLTGVAADRSRGRLFLITCLLSKAAGFLVLAFAESDRGYALGRMIDAASYAFLTTIIMSTTTLVADRRALGTAVGLFSGLPALLLIPVPLLGMQVYERFGGRITQELAAASLLAAVLLTFALRFPQKDSNEAHSKDRKVRHRLTWEDLFCAEAVPVCMLNFFISMLGPVLDAYLILLAMERGIPGAEIYLSVKSIINVIAAVAGGSLSDIIQPRKLLIAGCIATSAASLLFGSTHSTVMIVFASCLYFLAQRGTMPVLIKAASEVALPGRRGAAMATNFFIQDFAGVAGGYIAALCARPFGIGGAFYVVAAFPVIGIFLFLLIVRQSQKQ